MVSNLEYWQNLQYTEYNWYGTEEDEVSEAAYLPSSPVWKSFDLHVIGQEIDIAMLNTHNPK